MFCARSLLISGFAHDFFSSWVLLTLLMMGTMIASPTTSCSSSVRQGKFWNPPPAPLVQDDALEIQARIAQLQERWRLRVRRSSSVSSSGSLKPRVCSFPLHGAREKKKEKLLTNFISRSLARTPRSCEPPSASTKISTKFSQRINFPLKIIFFASQLKRHRSRRCRNNVFLFFLH